MFLGHSRLHTITDPCVPIALKPNTFTSMCQQKKLRTKHLSMSPATHLMGKTTLHQMWQFRNNCPQTTNSQHPFTKHTWGGGGRENRIWELRVYESAKAPIGAQGKQPRGFDHQTEEVLIHSQQKCTHTLSHIQRQCDIIISIRKQTTHKKRRLAVAWNALSMQRFVGTPFVDISAYCDFVTLNKFMRYTGLTVNTDIIWLG